VAVNNPYTWGTGRRKTSAARVRIKPGTGKFLINGREFDAFFVTEDTRRVAVQPLVVTETRNNFDIWVNVAGGGITGQAGAVSLGIARALRRDNENFDKLLRFQVISPSIISLVGERKTKILSLLRTYVITPGMPTSKRTSL
jgi:small subunit ribosomal protein S9